jgi:Na+/H+-dicarboxylate symporter
MNFWTKRPLYFKIFVMMIIGCIVGWIVGPGIKVISPIGDAFILLLKMLVVPLVFFSIMSGVTKLGSPKEFRDIGGSVILYYVISSIVAVCFGTLLGLLIKPGLDAQGLLGLANKVSYKQYSAVDTILAWIPSNLVGSMASMDMIPVIFFAVFFGVCLIIIGDKGKPVVAVIDAANEAMLKMTELVTDLAPYGIFALSAVMVGTLGSKMLAVAAKFVLADYLGLLGILLIGYPLLLIFFGKISPIQFYKNIFPAMIVAASTTSSNATLPMSMKCARERVGLPEKLYAFSLPLGATVNMDGFACSLGIISLMALQVYDISITAILVIQIVYMGLMLSIGAAGVKGTAVVISAVLFEALNLPMGLLPLIAAIWPIVDIGHTTVNVTGDLVGSTIVGSRKDLLDLEIFHNKNAK